MTLSGLMTLGMASGSWKESHFPGSLKLQVFPIHSSACIPLTPPAITSPTLLE